MPVLLLPEFIVDLQDHADAHFAKRVLRKTILPDGNFKRNQNDHRYQNVSGAWIRYVSRGASAYRVIYIKSGADIYLYRAGEHDIENHLIAPQSDAFTKAISITRAGEYAATAIGEITKLKGKTPKSIANRFLRNHPYPTINRAIFSRRNLPHSDIWLVAPFITPKLLLPTASFGKMLFDQVEDGAKILLITAPPKSPNISWLEELEERDVGVFFYPRLHSKLYCFVLDENRKYERGLPPPDKLSSLLLVGSANVTAAGLALNEDKGNEELCYSVPDSEIMHVESYIAQLISDGYDLREARVRIARGKLQNLERNKW